MANKVNISLAVALGAVCIGAAVVGIIGSGRLIDARVCRGMDVDVEDGATIGFADSTSITHLMDSVYGGYRNLPVSALQLWRMEEILLGQSYVKDATLWCSRDGTVKVILSQVEPVAKFLTDTGLVYIARDGRCIHTRSDWNNSILRLSGEPRLADRQWMEQLGEAAVRVMTDERFSKRLDTLECLGNGECMPHVTGHSEHFFAGPPSNLMNSMEKLLKYEKKIHGQYDTVYLKYRGQIVCKPQSL